MIVDKAVKMAEKMNVKVLGLVENMSYLKCPDCGKEINIFGESRLYKTAGEFNISPAVKLPMDPAIAKACDEGDVSSLELSALEPLINKIGA